MRKHERQFYSPVSGQREEQIRAFDMRAVIAQIRAGRRDVGGSLKPEHNTILSGIHIGNTFIHVIGCLDLYRHVSRGKPLGLGEHDYGGSMVLAYNVNVRGQRTEESV